MTESSDHIGDNKYCIDTSGFIDAWERYYPPDVFPQVWESMNDLADKGLIFAPVQVYKEMQKQSDGVVTWAKPRKHIFLSLEAPIQKSLKMIMHDFPKGFVDPRTSRSGADPIVVAVGHAYGYTVVTGEKKGKRKKPKIPDVCLFYNIKCCTMMEMFRNLGIVFQ